MSDIQVISPRELSFRGKTYRCAIGANGVTDTPKEGDRATPLGNFALRECWYRPDRLARPKTSLPLKPIRENDGWCDASADPNYNRHVLLPYSASHENLWLGEHIYDIIVPLGFNDDPVTPGKGSAIFFHIAKPDYSPTLGCVAVSFPDMLAILAKVEPSTRIVIRT